MDERSGARGCIVYAGYLSGLMLSLYLIYKFFELIFSAIF